MLGQRFSSQYGRFLRSWLEDPLAVGALAPSGRRLAKLMTRDLAAGARVVEIGPGTGTFTREILARGVDRSDLILLERCAGFAAALELEFPEVVVVQGDATEPQERLLAYRGSIDFVISGLPLVLFSRAQKTRLLECCFELLHDEGAFYQFTYGGRCPLDRRVLERLGLVARCLGFVARNVPPAFVYRVARAEPARLPQPA